ncbi:cytochrome c oxidase subunit 6b-1-like [Hibiscus syriacus]|uniref:cytochrome c oxidase subunit 6b-1-like n=1 Tax=Hibiscus syriacus TaxID=106335 RepID=UPI001922C12F|nr:cytochrome c oxidase subunit 6b-1-like [Hibiscus syriacus]
MVHCYYGRCHRPSDPLPYSVLLFLALALMLLALSFLIKFEIDMESTEASPAPAEESTEAISTAENSGEYAPAAAVNSDDAEETPKIKLETAPTDFRFPTTNQTRECFARYIEYHRCVAAKGEYALECDKFAKFYRALCPGEWGQDEKKVTDPERLFEDHENKMTKP